MTTTKRLLCSATGLLLAAGPGVASTDGGPVKFLTARTAHGRDERCHDRSVGRLTVRTDDCRPRRQRARIRRPWRPPVSTTVVTVPASTTTVAPTSTTLAAPTTTAGTTTTTTVATTTTTVAATTTTAAATTTTAAATTTTVAPTTTTTVAPTTTTTVAPTTTTTAAPTTPQVDGLLVNLVAGARSVVPAQDNPNRGFVGRITVTNPTGATVAVTLTISGSSPAGFPKFLEAADYATGTFTCVTGDNTPYYRVVTLAPTFVCTGSLAAADASVITVSSGSLIAAGAVGQPVTVTASVAPGGATRMLAGTFT